MASGKRPTVPPTAAVATQKIAEAAVDKANAGGATRQRPGKRSKSGLCRSKRDMLGYVTASKQRREALRTNMEARDADEARCLDALLRLSQRRVSVELMLEAWKGDGNPMHAWRIWQRCRRLNIQLPAEVLKYLDDTAAALLDLAARPPKRVAPAVQKSLGLHGKSGRGSGISRLHALTRQAAIVEAVEQEKADAAMKGKRIVVSKIVGKIAGRFNMTEEAVRRAVSDFG